MYECMYVPISGANVDDHFAIKIMHHVCRNACNLPQALY